MFNMKYLSVAMILEKKMILNVHQLMKLMNGFKVKQYKLKL